MGIHHRSHLGRYLWHSLLVVFYLDETLWTRFILNVGSSITVFIYGGCKYLMWFLIWLQFLHGEFEYYHIDTFGSEENCKIQLEKSKVLITNSASSVACFEVDRNG